ncbi:MAG TPA: hypothetical protein VFE47_27585 [Tepidisphaeraceae bacterium]|jgi:hypothetical protein|nr:hypothetical protein [Tepidisphaeraceae bacterium]
MKIRTQKRKPVKDIPQLTTAKAFERLSAQEKEDVYNYFDREIPASELRDPTSAQAAVLARHRKKMGRPQIGQGAKVVAVTLEKGLLQRVDEWAKKHEMKRSEVITRGLNLVIGKAP